MRRYAPNVGGSWLDVDLKLFLITKYDIAILCIDWHAELTIK